MKALCFDEAPAVRDVDEPTPGPNEALIRVRRAGICNTDLEIVRGYMGFRGVLGHELVGEVEASDDASLVGRRVVGEINLSCGHCDECGRELRRHCDNRSVMGIVAKDGCFAEYVTLPVENLHVVPDGLSDEAAAFVEPLAAAFEILEQVHIDPGSRVAVLGDGKLGLLVAMVLHHEGLVPTLLGHHQHKLAIARVSGIDVGRPESARARSFDVVVEATGAPEGFARAAELVRPRGTLVLKSTYHGAMELRTAPLVVNEITIVGSRCGPFEPALVALTDGAIDPSPLIQATYPLVDGVRAIEHASSPGALKIALVPGW